MTAFWYLELLQTLLKFCVFFVLCFHSVSNRR